MERHEARRLAKRLASLPADVTSFSNMLRRRADVRTYWAHPGVITELANDARVSLGGARALAALEGLAEGSAPLLGYIDANEASHVVAKYRAKPDPAGNVQLALIAWDVPAVLRPEPGKLTFASVTYTDALEADDARARWLGGQWLRQLRACLDLGSSR